MKEPDKSFDRRVLVAVDVTGYGAGTDQDHFSVQAGLTEVLETAAAKAGLRREQWVIQSAGDGELAILPPDQREPVVVDEYVRHLDEALTAHNSAPGSGPSIRLRMAVHFGAAMPADNGYAGQGVVAVSRLVEAPAVKRALADDPNARLALILSNQVYMDVVQQGHVSVPKTDFTRIGVQVKQYKDTAWVKVLGAPDAVKPSDPDVNPDRAESTRSGPDKSSPKEPAPDEPAPHAPSLVQHFQHVDAPGATFGISYGARGNG